jgi:hypothetical protein
MTESGSIPEGPGSSGHVQTEESPRGVERRPKGRRRSLLILGMASALALGFVLGQLLLVFVVVPQQIRSAEPVVIDQSDLLSDGPYVGCFSFLSSYGGIFHQGEPFSLSWTIQVPSTLNGSCTLQRIDRTYGPLLILDSNLPLTILPGAIGVLTFSIAPINQPYWGGVMIGVVVTNP